MTRPSPSVFLLALLAVAPAAAQSVPAHISVVEGHASIARLSGSEPAEADVPLEEGDRVITTDGRLEIVTGGGSVVHLDAGSAIDVNASGVLRLLGGRLVVSSMPNGGEALQVDALPASVRVGPGSEGRLSLFQDASGVFLDVSMVRGSADILTAMSATSIMAGERVVVRDGQPASAAMAFNSAESDSFYDWSNALLDSRRGTTSAEYLPADLTSYGAAFDEYGSWSYMAPYGYVWYPHVDSGWRPYYHGRWCYRPHVGWSFSGGDRWTWPTHHYGRWGVASSGSWYWIPGNTWSSAWVQWAVAPGYVSWCPLGGNNAPVGRFWTDRTHSGSHPGDARGWTVLRTGTFASGGNPSRHAIDPHTLSGAGSPPFAVQTAPPLTAVARGTVGIVGRSAASATTSATPTDGMRTTPRGPRFIATPEGQAPPVVYYRGGSVSTSAVGQTPTHEHVAEIPRGESHGMRRTTAHDASATGILAVPGAQPPPIPYRNGPPIIAVPRATPPGGFHTGPPVLSTPPPVISTPPPTISAPPGAHPAPSASPPPTAHPVSSGGSHATASPRSGPR